MWIGAEPKRRACADIIDVVKVARRYTNAIISLFFVSFCVTCVIYFITPRQYSASISVEIGSHGIDNYPENVSRNMRQLLLDDIHIQSQLRVMLSDVILTNAFCHLRSMHDGPHLCEQSIDGIMQDGESIPLSINSRYKQAFFDFKSSVSARRVDLSYNTAITVWSSSSSKAVQSANSVVMSYVRRELEEFMSNALSDDYPHKNLVSRLNSEIYIVDQSVIAGIIPREVLTDSNIRLFESARPDAVYFPQLLPMVSLSFIVSGVLALIFIMFNITFGSKVYSKQRIRYILDYQRLFDVPISYIWVGSKPTASNLSTFYERDLDKMRSLISASGLSSSEGQIGIIEIVSTSMSDQITQQLNTISCGYNMSGADQTEIESGSCFKVGYKGPKFIRILEVDKMGQNGLGDLNANAVIMFIELGYATVNQLEAALSNVNATTLPLIAVLLARN